MTGSCERCGEEITVEVGEPCPHCRAGDPLGILRRRNRIRRARANRTSAFASFWKRWGTFTLMLLGGSVFVLIVAVNGSDSPQRPASQRTPPPPSACESEFRRVAAIDEMQDVVTDLDKAVRTCGSLDEWTEMARRYPAAVEPDIAVTFLRNRCDFGQIESPLCEEVLGR